MRIKFECPYEDCHNDDIYSHIDLNQPVPKMLQCDGDGDGVGCGRRFVGWVDGIEYRNEAQTINGEIARQPLLDSYPCLDCGTAVDMENGLCLECANKRGQIATPEDFDPLKQIRLEPHSKP